MAFSKLRAKIEQRIEEAIRSGITQIAEDAKSNADWSKDIPDSIRIGDVKQESKGVWSGEIIVDLKKAPQAAAYEYGSGIHGEKGERYIIKPKDAPVLAFPWNPSYIPWNSPKFKGVIRTGEGTEGKYFFHYVEHPGVEARPYLRPAIIKNRDALKSRFLNLFIKGYREAIDVKVVIE